MIARRVQHPQLLLFHLVPLASPVQMKKEKQICLSVSIPSKQTPVNNDWVVFALRQTFTNINFFRLGSLRFALFRSVLYCFVLFLFVSFRKRKEKKNKNKVKRKQKRNQNEPKPLRHLQTANVNSCSEAFTNDKWDNVWLVVLWNKH